jgi:chromosome segregation ATPase
MTDETPFAAWHDELRSELGEAQEEHAAAADALRDAEAAHADAVAQHQRLSDAIATLRQSIASCLAQRVRFSDESVHDTASAVAHARRALSGLHERVSDLEQGLSQLMVLMAPAAEAAEDVSAV